MSFAEHKTTAHAAGGTHSVLETPAVTPQSWMGAARCLEASLPSAFPLSSRTQPLFSPVPGGCRALAEPRPLCAQEYCTLCWSRGKGEAIPLRSPAHCPRAIKLAGTPRDAQYLINQSCYYYKTNFHHIS